MDPVELGELGQRSVSDRSVVADDHEPEPAYLGVVGMVPPAPVLADEE